MLTDVIYNIGQELARYSADELNEMKYKFCRIRHRDEKWQKLYHYREVLQSAMLAERYGEKPCVDPTEVIEKVKSILGKQCTVVKMRRDRIVDTTNQEAFFNANPMCLPTPKWKEYCKCLCDELSIDIKIEDIRCDLVADLLMENISCELLTEWSISNIDCKLNANVKVTHKECRLEYNTLISEINCDLSYNLYYQVRNCGISYNLVRKTYECGLSFSYSEGTGCYLVVNDNLYPTAEIDFDEIFTKGKYNIIYGTIN